MARDLGAVDGAMLPYPPGPLFALTRGNDVVTIAPQAGGRIAQITRRGEAWLADFGEASAAMIGWGCYPMLPWAGRLRQGRFDVEGKHYQLPLNLGAHAIHGLGFAMPWAVQSHTATLLEMSLELPRDTRWPFGGVACQRIELLEDRLDLQLSLQAGDAAMPATIGWHPWFRKPARLTFAPTAMYPRDAAGIATLPLVAPAPGPWDDCFIHAGPVVLERGEGTLTLTSDCTHWVVYDQDPAATCVEPQSGPPDAFNIAPCLLAPGGTLARRFELTWAV